MARERIAQFQFRGPENLDLTGIDGLGDAIGDIGQGLQARRANNTLAGLGLEAVRLQGKQTGNGQQQRPDSSANNIALINEARVAIQLGARPSRVLQRLRTMGVDLTGVV